MTTLRIMSDLHLEFEPLDAPILPYEKDNILILAGDIGIAKKSFTYGSFLFEMSERFKHIIYIMGNHEHYDGSIKVSIDKIKENLEADDIHNVYVIDNEVVRIDNISFVCSTLWASFNDGDPLSMMDAGRMMNDHHLIRTGPSKTDAYQRKFSPEDAFQEHIKAKDFLEKAIPEEKANNQRVCVVTHHCPSLKSIASQYHGSILNGAFTTDLDDFILEHKPEVWIHGHTHTCFQYDIGETKIICNPRGYPGENPFFDPTLTYTLD